MCVHFFISIVLKFFYFILNIFSFYITLTYSIEKLLLIFIQNL